MKGSIRLKLVLWNLAALTIALVAFALILGFTNLNRLKGDIDRDLENHGQEVAGLRPRGPGRPGGPPNGPGPGQGFGMQMGRRDGPPGKDGPRMGAGSMYDVRRPRFFDLKGVPMGQAEYNQPFDTKLLAGALEGKANFSSVTFNNGPIRVYASPWFRDGERIGAIEVAREIGDVDLLRQGQIQTLLILLPIALIASGIGAFFLATRVLRPINEFAVTAREISATDLGQRLPVSGNDEFAALAVTFNEMLDRLQGSFQALKEAFERQRQFTADASHELRTPLTRLKLATSAALVGETGDYRKALESADRATTDMVTLVDQMLVLAQADSGALSSSDRGLDLRVVAAETLEAYPESEITVDLPSSPVMIKGDEALLHRLVRNLIDNSIRYGRSDMPIKVSIGEKDGKAILTIADTGAGIDAAHLPHLFDRFYRGDAARSASDGGAGLGLAICKSIVEAHAGSISIQSTVKQGTTVEINFPILKKSLGIEESK